MSLQTVPDFSDAVILESNLGLYLKPITRIKINVQLPKITLPGQSISSWHVMEKLRSTVLPDAFLNLKTLKITSAVIKFEGELETKAACERALARLRASSSLKISGFSEKLLVRAAHSTASGPTRHDWEAFFRDAKGVNEMKPGERPDTIHLQELPVRWFCEGSKNAHPNEKQLKLAFGTFGKVRRLEVPKVESSVNAIGKTNSMQKDLLFEVYVQYEEYVEFAIAMDSLRGKKLLYKESNGKVYSADIKVDFDRTRYLSEACIKKREADEKKLNPDPVEKEKETTKDRHSHATSQAKPESQAPVKVTFPTQAVTHSPVQSVKDPNSNVKKEVGDIILKEKRKAQIEAELLLRELLLKAEKTERQKEQATQLDVDHKQLKPKKRSSESSSLNETCDKKLKVENEQLNNELEPMKSKNNIPIEYNPFDLLKSAIAKGKGKQAAEKQALSKERKFTESPVKESKQEQHSEKRIKTENKDKSLEKKNKEKVSRSDKDKHKERTSMKNMRDSLERISNCLKTTSHHEKKNKEKDSPTRYERTTKDYDSVYHDKKHKDKETDKKTTKDYKHTSKEKRHKEKDTPVYYEKTIENYDTVHHKKKHKDKKSEKYNNKDSSSKHKKKHSDKVLVEDEEHMEECKGETDIERMTALNEKEEERRMYLEEQKIKERLIQAYNQKKRNEAKLLEQERILKEKLLRNMKEREREKLKEREREKLKEREQLRRELSGRNVLKSVLGSANSPNLLYKKR